MTADHSALVIEVSTASAGLYLATLNGEPLCRTRTPFVAAARRLTELGYPPELTLTMRWSGTAHDALRAKLGAASRLTIIENDRGGPTFGRYYTPRPECRSPVQGSAQDGDFEAPAIPGPGARLKPGPRPRQ